MHAKDTLTGKDQSITIAPGSGLTEEEIQNMVTDAEKYSAQDCERKAALEAANHANSVVEDKKEVFKEFADRLDKAEADQIREKLGSLRECVAKCQFSESTATVDDIKQRIKELQTANVGLLGRMNSASPSAIKNPPRQGYEGEKRV